MVGDPKQSIYRFRRADARLFQVARVYLQENFAAQALHNHHTRRNAPAIVAAVNAVFREQPAGFEFVEHGTYQHDLPGTVQEYPNWRRRLPYSIEELTRRLSTELSWLIRIRSEQGLED
jgi:ATP-dependent helicase/nuclease subunit A